MKAHATAIRWARLDGRVPYLLISLLWPTAGAAQSAAPAAPVTSLWTWEFMSSRAPRFEEKREESDRWLVVELLFRNEGAREQRLVVARPDFQATTRDDRPVEVLGLLYRWQNLGGAKRMGFVGGMQRMETISEGQGGSVAWFVYTPGPLEAVVDRGKSYTQRLVLTRPEGKEPFRLRFKDLPELEVHLAQ